MAAGGEVKVFECFCCSVWCFQSQITVPHVGRQKESGLEEVWRCIRGEEYQADSCLSSAGGLRRV